MQKIKFLIMGFLLVLPVSAVRPWWNSLWLYRREIVINNTGGAITNFTREIWLNSTNFDFSHADSTGKDIRFVNSSGKKLAYWIEWWNTTGKNQARVWFKIPFLPNGTTTIYLYYGNPSATSAETSPDSIFLFWEDCEDVSDWSTTAGVISSSTMWGSYEEDGSHNCFYNAPYGYGRAYRIFAFSGTVGFSYAHYWETVGDDNHSGMLGAWYSEDYPGISPGYVYTFSHSTSGFFLQPPGRWIDSSPPAGAWEIVHWIIEYPRDKVDVRANITSTGTTSEQIWVDQNSSRPAANQIGVEDGDSNNYRNARFDALKVYSTGRPEPTYSIGPEEVREIKIPPAKKRLLLVNEQNALLCSNLASKFPVIITNQVTDSVQHFINQYNPDQILTVGVSYSNSIPATCQALQTQFINTSKYLTLGNNHSLNLAALPLATQLDLELNQESIDYIKVNGVVHDLNSVLDLVSQSQVNNLILVDPNSKISISSGLLASLRPNSIVLPVTGTPDQILTKLSSLEKELRNKGRYTGSQDYKFGEPVYLTLIGVPYFQVADPGLEDFDLDGDHLLTDNPYSDLNQDSSLDLAFGRLAGNLTTISLQLARENKLDKKALIASEYNHRKFLDLFYLGGGMLSGLQTEVMLRGAEFEVTRLTEHRSKFEELNLSTIKQLKDEYERITGLDIPEVIRILAEIYGILEISTESLYSLLEFDWYQYLHELYPFKVKRLPSLTEESLDLNLPQNDFIFYFGQGDESKWILPKSNRSEIELILNPYPPDSPQYARFPWLKSSLVYADHDLSARLQSKFVSRGAVSFLGSTGITHDLQSQFTLIHFLTKLLGSKSVGESIRYAKNRNLIGLGLSHLYRLIITGQTIPEPSLDLKEGLERILYGDPQFTPLSTELENPESYNLTYLDGEFVLEKSFSIDYTLTPNRTVLISAKNYLLKFEKPIVPLKIYEFTLPTGSEILDLDLIGDYVLIKNVSIPVLPYDEYYNKTSKPFSGIFPNQSFWFQESKLLDNRSLITITVPLIIYQNNTAKILTDGKIKLTYRSPLDIFNLWATREKISLSVVNNLDLSVNPQIFIRIENSTTLIQEQNKTVVVDPKSKKLIEFDWAAREGIYLIKAIATYDNLTIGPRMTLVNITKQLKIPRIKRVHNLVTGRIVEVITAFWRVKESLFPNRTKKTYLKPQWNLTIQENPTYKLTKLKTSEFYLEINESYHSKHYHLICPDGELIRTIANGKVKEEYFGDEYKLERIFEKSLQILEKAIAEMDSKI